MWRCAAVSAAPSSRMGCITALPPGSLSVIVNTADDFQHLGLQISPDLDTVLYTLGGRADMERGWGRANETWHFMGALEEISSDLWFQIGDRDMAMHVARTHWLQWGKPLSGFRRACRPALQHCRAGHSDDRRHRRDLDLHRRRPDAFPTLFREGALRAYATGHPFRGRGTGKTCPLRPGRALRSPPPGHHYLPVKPLFEHRSDLVDSWDARSHKRGSLPGGCCFANHFRQCRERPGGENHDRIGISPLMGNRRSALHGTGPWPDHRRRRDIEAGSPFSSNG